MADENATPVPTSIDKPTRPEHVSDKLETPSLDDRCYRVIRLQNQLEVLLVHDPDTDKASAALDVNVGNYSDPEDMPGMAHAVEHLLFMGTEKYPVENAYSQYLSAHSGYSNAYTASTSTNYYFEVAASSSEKVDNAEVRIPNGNIPDISQSESPLYGALDRFAQFFIAPLFLSSTLDRELRAVDSENKKNLQSDQWRLHQLSKTLSNPKHPFCHFSTGNLETLRDKPRERGVEIRQEFIKFYQKHYSANRMKLVVLGRESLDQLEGWVVKLFSNVKNQNLPQNRWDDAQPLTEKELLTQYFAKPVMDSRMLDVHFPFLDEEYLFETQPSRYLSHLIGHEGPGSILAYIKAKGWANGLSAGSMPICPGAALFSISVRLTEDGLKHYKEIVQVIFQYIALLRETPPLKWVVDEMKGMSEVDFRFKQKSPASKTTSKISSVMQKPLPREWLLSGSYLIRRFDAEAISEALSYLRPDNFRLAIVSQNLEGLDQKEPWYGTEYKCEKISRDFLDQIKQAADGSDISRPAALHLPQRNEFIPTKLEVDKKEVKDPLKAPKLIRNDERIRLWWKKDDRFWVPKGNVFLTIRSPLVNVTPENAAKTKLYCELVNDALVEYAYDAEIAGLNYGLGSHTLGLDVEVSGYNDKMSVLLEKVLLSMRELEVRPDRFKVVKERLLRAYRNWDFQQPYKQVGDYTRWLNSEKGWINDQVLAELSHLTESDVQQFYPQILQRAHVEILAHGNIYKEDALNLANLIESTIRPRPLPESQWSIRRSLIYPPGASFSHVRTLKDPANVNHCLEYVLYVGDSADRSLRAKLQLFAQMTEEPAFDRLRTKEQLGYIVFSGVRVNATTMGYRVIIQSERPAGYLEERVEAFLQTFGTGLEAMTAEAFEGHRWSLINRRLEKLKNLGEESQRFWTHVATEYFDFDQVDEDVSHIKTLAKADMVEFFQQYINPSASTRAKLSVHLLAKASAAEQAKSMSPQERNEKLLTLLSQYLSSEAIEADISLLRPRLAAIDIESDGPQSLVQAIGRFLTEDVQLETDKVTAILVKGQGLLEAALPALGIPTSSATQSQANGETESPPANGLINGEADGHGHATSETVVIEDVHAFKAGMAVSAGARPVKDLSEFEDLEPKL
ncbi:MAG: Insulinase (Peptidase M16) [Caeruleum heppii]|nr:MAG: Insulinase (Peptidase M16) [Caeruleum heppii]